MISPSKKSGSSDDIILDEDNIAEFTRMFEDHCDYNFGTPGQNICRGTESELPRLPTEDDKTAVGRRIYQLDPADSTQLSSRDYDAFRDAYKRAQTLLDKYKSDDLACVSFIFNHLSKTVNSNLRNSPAFKVYKTLPEGNRSYQLYQAVKKIVSTPDINSIVTRAREYLNIGFSGDINRTMDEINMRAEQFKTDFATVTHPDSVTFDKLKAVVVLGVLDEEGYQTFKQMYGAAETDALADSEKLIQAAIAFTSANKKYINSLRDTPDPESLRGQSYFANSNCFGNSYVAAGAGLNQSDDIPAGDDKYFYSKSHVSFPMFPADKVFQPKPHVRVKKFGIVGPPITADCRFCHDCYIRTGRCITSHGNPDQSVCRHPSSERNPESTAIKSYISEICAERPNPETCIKLLQDMDDVVCLMDPDF
jgi:hypothetical protein